MSPHERTARADRARAALDEFLGPAFDHVEREWYENLIRTASSSDPRSPEIISRLTAGIQAIRKVREQVAGYVSDGALADSEIAREAQLSKMTPHMRSVVGV